VTTTDLHRLQFAWPAIFTLSRNSVPLADMKNFFPYISHHQVFEVFRRNDFSPDVSHILTKLTTYKEGLPQGAPTSPIIANLVFIQTGIKLLEIANRNNLISQVI
jgi:hypothetical protein